MGWKPSTLRQQMHLWVPIDQVPGYGRLITVALESS